jgi:lipoprotein-anchoring transpeptidase ErfK/SrfK
MSAMKLSGRACTAVLCVALATMLSDRAFPQSLAYTPVDLTGSTLRQAAPQAEQPGLTPGDELAAPLRRQVVPYAGDEPPGTIIIDTAHTFLYLTLGDGKAIRYGIGVGREGFTWSGIETISRKSEWPDWIPPAEMIARQPYLPRWVGGGAGNPLGARALYLGNTAYRIHGTNNPSSIGKHVSSGCIRMRDADVIDLYDRVALGTRVVVLPNDQRLASVNDQRAATTGDQQRLSIEGGHGAPMTARILVGPIVDQVQPRAQWIGSSTLSGLY